MTIKKFYFFLFFIFLSAVISAEVFVPSIYLKGCVPVVDNHIEIYKIQKKTITTSTRKFLLNNIQLNTVQEIDYENRLIKLTLKFDNKIELYSPVYVSFEKYIKDSFKYIFRKFLAEERKEALEDKDKPTGDGLIPEIVIDLPKIALPRAVRKFMGNKAGRLSLDGSQKLTFAGSSTKTDKPGAEKDQSKDFDLEMRQDLNLRLRGTIGEKIHVNVNHSSSSDDDVMSTPDDININYEGFDDEVVKSIEGGNIALSLSGSKFISYTASSEGLFGVKTRMEFGNLQLTTIIGKDEAKKSKQKYKGSTQADSVNIKSKDFVARTHYFIDDPQELFLLYTSVDSISGEQYYSGYANNAIKTDETDSWIIKSPELIPDIGSVKVYRDDANANNNYETMEGTDLDGTSTFKFDQLTEGIDFTFNYDVGILKLYKTINKNYTIGVTYTRGGEQIGSDSPLVVKLLRESNQDNTSPYWDLQVRNIYSLGMQNIKSDGFKLDVFTYGADNTPNYYDEDGTLYNDYLRLDINSDGYIDGDDSTVDLYGGFIIYPFLKPFESLGDELIYEKEYITYDEFSIYMRVKGKIGREQISLNQMNILPGSVIIKLTTLAGQRTLKENIDYMVDYDFGSIIILDAEAKDTENEIDISYQFKPLFSIESKTLMGLRADMIVNENLKLGGTFIYQSEKVSDDRPKIGNENRSIILADIDGEFEFEAPFLTKMVNWLPLIRTDEESKISLTGEVAMSLPRIYGSTKQDDKKEAYIDDMESILDSYPLGVARRTWVSASKPFDIDYGKAKINWFNPQNIEAKDVYDPSSLSEKEEKEKVSVLACKITPLDIGNPGITNKYWTGVMKYIGDQVDLSRKKYLEFLVKVDSLPNIQNPKPVIMHIDLGDLNEDFYTNFGGEGVLNTEDGIVGTYPDGSLDYGEDVGLDGIETGDPGDDPNDDYDNEDISIDGDIEYPYINGTEGNGYLDSEDLDGDGNLNIRDIYFEYTVSLADTATSFLSGEYNNWKLYRIPIHDSDYYRIISDNDISQPDLEKISYARIWFEVEEKARIKIVSADLVGNKWEEMSIRDENGEAIQPDNESMIVGIIDNQKNPDYTPAPGTVIKKDGEVTLEQSLMISYNNLGPGHYGLVHQRFRDPSSQNKGLDLLGYSKIRFWLYTESNNEALSDSLVIRLGSDSLNYYEICHPLEAQDDIGKMVKDGWKSIEVDFSELTYLKSLSYDRDTSYVKIKDGKQYRFSKVNSPTLSNIKEIYLGMQASEEFTGRLYFDDIRVADPYEDIGFAARTDFHTSFADFSTLDITLKWLTPNFQSSATRKKTQSYVQSTDMNISNKYNLHKFFPSEWGLSLPLNLSRNSTIGIPRYKANSDILREDLKKEDKEREINKSLIYGASTSFSLNKTPKNKILAYTIKNTTINASIQKKNIKSSTSIDTTSIYTAKHTYKLNIPKEKISLGLWSNYQFYFLPNTFNNTLSYKAEYPRKWRWDTYSDSIPLWVPQSNTKNTKTLDTDTYIKYDIFSDISSSYKITTNRDLMLGGYFYDIPIGKEKKRTQTITLDFEPRYLDKIFSFSSDAEVKYRDEHKKISTTVTGDYLFYGDVNRSIGVNFTLKNRDFFTGINRLIDSSKSKGKEKEEDKSLEDKLYEEKLKEKEKEEILKKQELEKLQGFEQDIKEEEEQEIKEEKEEEIKEEIEEIESKEDLTEKKEEEKTEDQKEEKQKEKEDKYHMNPFLQLLAYIGRLENIRINYNNSYSTGYEKRENRPEFLYQLGVPHALSDDEIKRKGITDKISANTGFPILNILNTSLGYSYEIKKTYENPAEDYGNMTITTVFPNVSATLTDFEKIIKAENILTSSRLSSSYVMTEIQQGVIDWDSPKTLKTTISMQPLISWNGNWIHNVTSSLSLNYYKSESVTDNGDFNSINKETKQSVNADISWTFSAEKGIKLPFFKKRFVIKNEMTADIDLNYEKVYNTKRGSGEPVVERDLMKYTITPGASYKFSQNIKAGLSSSYNWNHNRKNNQKIKTFRLSIWIEILF